MTEICKIILKEFAYDRVAEFAEVFPAEAQPWVGLFHFVQCAGRNRIHFLLNVTTDLGLVPIPHFSDLTLRNTIDVD